MHSIGSLNKINISQANIKPQKIINYFNWGYCVKHTRGRNSPYKKQEAPIDLICHHALPIKDVEEIFKQIFDSIEVNLVDKKNLLSQIKGKIYEQKDKFKLEGGVIKVIEKFESQIDHSRIELNEYEQGVLHSVFSYFYGVVFIAPREDTRIKPLQAKDNFDKFVKFCVPLEQYELIKKLRISHSKQDIKSMYDNLLSLSGYKLAMYKHDEWCVNQEKGNAYPKCLEPLLKEYFELQTLRDKCAKGMKTNIGKEHFQPDTVKRERDELNRRHQKQINKFQRFMEPTPEKTNF